MLSMAGPLANWFYLEPADEFHAAEWESSEWSGDKFDEYAGSGDSSQIRHHLDELTKGKTDAQHWRIESRLWEKTYELMFAFQPVIQLIAAELLQQKTIDRWALEELIDSHLPMKLLEQHVLPLENWFNKPKFPWLGPNAIFVSDNVKNHKSYGWLKRHLVTSPGFPF
jgi:hypothetical protein